MRLPRGTFRRIGIGSSKADNLTVPRGDQVPRKSSKRPPAVQPKPPRPRPSRSKAAIAAAEAELRAEIRRIYKRAREQIAEAEARIAERARIDRQRQKEADARARKERERAAKLFERTGLFDPAKHKTKSGRTRRVKSLMDQFRDFINPKTMVFVPTKSKRAATKARGKAKELGITTTPKGFFFPREGAKRVKLTYDKKRGEYAVESERVETSSKTGKRRKVTRVYPLESMRSADEKVAALKATGERLLGKKPRHTDRLAFTVEGPHRGRSKHIYETPELMERDLKRRYDRSQHAPAHLKGKYRSQFIGFLDLVAVKKTTRGEWVNETIKQRQSRKKVRRYGRPRKAATSSVRR
jgi:hypothetical protein